MKHGKNVINDVHTELTDFYNSIKNGHSQDIHNFMAELDKYGVSKQTYRSFKDNYEANYKLVTRPLVLNGNSKEEIDEAMLEYESILTLANIQEDLQKITINA